MIKSPFNQISFTSSEERYYFQDFIQPIAGTKVLPKVAHNRIKTNIKLIHIITYLLFYLGDNYTTMVPPLQRISPWYSLSLAFTSSGIWQRPSWPSILRYGDPRLPPDISSEFQLLL